MARNDMPPLNALVAFEAVARNLSFTAAARELRVTQAAVSQHVKGLEAHLGIDLVRRERPAIRLTSEGELLAAAVETGIDRIGQAVRLIQRRGRDNKLAVATMVAFSSFWLMPRLPRFHARHPEVEFRLAASDTGVDWDGEQIDLAIVFAKRAPAGYAAQRLFGDEIVAVARPDVLARHGPISDPADLAAETLLHFEFPGQDWMRWADWFRATGVAHEGPLKGPRFNNYILLIQAALDGQGFAMGWRRLVAPLIERGELAQVTAATVVSTAAFYLIVPQRLAHDRSVAAFRDWIVQEAAADW